MKYGIMLLSALALGGCGRTHYEYYKGEKGDPGNVGSQGPVGPAGPVGASGDDGADAVLEIIDPCNDAPGIVDEVLIRLSDGRVLCSFSANANGQNTRLAVLPAGSYVTTDGSNCHFSVNVAGNITY